MYVECKPFLSIDTSWQSSFACFMVHSFIRWLLINLIQSNTMVDDFGYYNWKMQLCLVWANLQSMLLNEILYTMNNSKQIPNCNQYTIGTICLLMKWLKLYICKTILSMCLSKASFDIISHHEITKIDVNVSINRKSVLMNCVSEWKIIIVKWINVQRCWSPRTCVVLIYVVWWFLIKAVILTFTAVLLVLFDEQ